MHGDYHISIKNILIEMIYLPVRRELVTFPSCSESESRLKKGVIFGAAAPSSIGFLKTSTTVNQFHYLRTSLTINCNSFGGILNKEEQSMCYWFIIKQNL